MSSMAIDGKLNRRALLIGSVVALGGTALSRRGFAAGAAQARYAATAERSDGSHAVLLLSASGEVVREVALSARGHDIAVHQGSGQAVAFARRPGTFAVAFGFADRRSPQVFHASEGRHFYGHGAFSADGRLLYATENDFKARRGVIGIYDATGGYKKIGEFPSFGLGPHELILLRDGRTLAIANGGIDTVPDYGRVDLNTDTMEPALSFVDASSGRLIARHRLAADLHQLSIRHLAEAGDGQIWFGGQWRGAQSETPELIGVASAKMGLRLIEPGRDEHVDLKGYIGAVAVSGDGATIAASAPRAGRVLYIDAASKTIRGVSQFRDVSGIAGGNGERFSASNGFGVLREEDAGRSGPAGREVISEAHLADVAFDNHLRRWG